MSLNVTTCRYALNAIQTFQVSDSLRGHDFPLMNCQKLLLHTHPTDGAKRSRFLPLLLMVGVFSALLDVAFVTHMHHNMYHTFLN